MTPMVFARVQPLLNEFLVSRCFQDIFEKHGLLDRVAHWSDDELLEAKTLRSWADRFWLDLLMLPDAASACDFCLKTCTDFAKTFQQAFQTPGGHDHKKIYAAFSQAGGPPDQQCNSGQRSRMVKDGQSMSKYV